MQDLKPQRAIESDSSWHFVGAQCDRADPVDHGQSSRFISQYRRRAVCTDRGSWLDATRSSVRHCAEIHVPSDQEPEHSTGNLAALPTKRLRGISSPCVRAIHGGSAIMGTGAPHPRSGSRKANCQFHVVLSCAQLRNWAPIRLAPARSAASRTDLKKLAPARLASVNVAPLRI